MLPRVHDSWVYRFPGMIPGHFALVSLDKLCVFSLNFSDSFFNFTLVVLRMLLLAIAVDCSQMFSYPKVAFEMETKFQNRFSFTTSIGIFTL